MAGEHSADSSWKQSDRDLALHEIREAVEKIQALLQATEGVSLELLKGVLEAIHGMSAKLDGIKKQDFVVKQPGRQDTEVRQGSDQVAQAIRALETALVAGREQFRQGANIGSTEQAPEFTQASDRAVLEEMLAEVKKITKQLPQDNKITSSARDPEAIHYRDIRAGCLATISAALLITACAMARASASTAGPLGVAGVVCGAGAGVEGYLIREKIAKKMGCVSSEEPGRSCFAGVVSSARACPGKSLHAITDAIRRCHGFVFDKENAAHFVTGRHDYDYKGNKIVYEQVTDAEGVTREMDSYKGATCQTARGAALATIGSIGCVAGLVASSSPVAWVGACFPPFVVGGCDVQEYADRRFDISTKHKDLGCYGSLKRGICTIFNGCHATRMFVNDVAMGKHEPISCIDKQPTAER